MANNSAFNAPDLYNIKFILFFYILLSISDITTGQPCDKIMTKSSTFSLGKEYKPYNIFRTALVKINSPIGCCAYFLPDKNYIIVFRTAALNKLVKLRLVDKNSNKVLFDNSDENYIQETNFSVADNPVNLIIEITLLNKDNLLPVAESDEYCAAFWIFMKKKSD